MRDEIKQPLNIAELVREYVSGYRISQPDHRFELRVETEPLYIKGNADHLAQMLDKLIDNAVQFQRRRQTHRSARKTQSKRRRNHRPKRRQTTTGRTPRPTIRPDGLLRKNRRAPLTFRFGLIRSAPNNRIPQRHKPKPKTEPNPKGVAVTVAIPALDEGYSFIK